jgi:hypothetical protein
VTHTLNLSLLLVPTIRSTSSAVLPSHHTMALKRHLPVVLSQRIVVSRWLVMPTPFSRLRSSACRAPPTFSRHVTTDWYNISGSCSNTASLVVGEQWYSYSTRILVLTPPFHRWMESSLCAGPPHSIPGQTATRTASGQGKIALHLSL